MIVLACPSCARQYDVTALQPGSRVRCVCDEVFEVKRPAALPVEALVCSHCGGPVGPADAACPYCGTALSATDRRASMLCPGCLARIAADSQHCRACGVAIAPQALTAIPAGRACPRCAGELGVRDLGRTSVVECQRCGGLWLSSRTFADVCRRATEEEIPWLPPREGEEPASAEPVRYIPCLTCGDLMNRRQFRHRGVPSRVVIDWCRHHGVWLDGSELAAVVAFLRSGAHRSRPPAPAEERSTIRKPTFDARDVVGASPGRSHPLVEVLEYLGRLLFG